MIALLQRVNWAQVRIDNKLHAEIKQGLLIFLGLEKEDSVARAEKLLDKILSLRIFPDAAGKMNLDLKDVAGELLVVSQFTLAASTDKGLRPSFTSAMAPAEAEQLYNHVIARARERHQGVASGKFAADMQISLENNGPVTFILRS